MCITKRHDMTIAAKVALNPNTTNPMFRAFADDKSNVAKIMTSILNRAENIVRIGENAGFQHFPTMFSRCFLTQGR